MSAPEQEPRDAYAEDDCSTKNALYEDKIPTTFGRWQARFLLFYNLYEVPRQAGIPQILTKTHCLHQHSRTLLIPIPQLSRVRRTGIRRRWQQQEAISKDGSFNQSKVIEYIAILQGQSEGEQFCCMRLTGCSHLLIVSFHMSCCARAAAASGGLFVFQILVYVFVSFSTVST